MRMLVKRADDSRVRSKLSQYLLHLHTNEPDKLLGIRLSIGARTYVLSRYRQVPVTNEIIVTLHCVDHWPTVLTRSLHLL